MTTLLAAAEPTDWTRGLVGLLGGVAAMWVGWRVWEGRYPGPSGPRPQYQTYFGVGHVAVVGGAGFALMSAGEIVRGTLGLGRDAPFFMTVSIVGVALLAVTFLYTLAYFWIGVPPRLRPPYQRDQLPPDHGRPKWRDRIRGRR